MTDDEFIDLFRMREGLDHKSFASGFDFALFVLRQIGPKPDVKKIEQTLVDVVAGELTLLNTSAEFVNDVWKKHGDNPPPEFLKSGMMRRAEEDRRKAFFRIYVKAMSVLLDWGHKLDGPIKQAPEPPIEPPL